MNSGDPVVSSVWFLLLVVEKNLNKVEDAQNIHPFKVMSNFLFFFVFYSPFFKETLCSQDWPVENKSLP